MKTKKCSILFLYCLGVVLAGCNQTPIDDDKDLPQLGSYTYYNTIEIDSAASACGVDSCVINLPWLSDKINAFLKDSAERKKDIATVMRVNMVIACVDSIDMTYYSLYLEDIFSWGTLWFNCAGDTIWKDPYWFVTWGDTTITSDKEEKFIHILENDGQLIMNQSIVKIKLGANPHI